MVAPVVIVQDLTKGPYQSGVTPAAGELRLVPSGGTVWSFAVLLNDKPGSLTPVLDQQFKDRTFSFTWADISNIGITGPVDSLALTLTTRAAIVALGVPTGGNSLVSIQTNDGSIAVPVEIFSFAAVAPVGSNIWRGALGDNTNTLGSRRTFENIQPNITIGPEDALVFKTTSTTAGIASMQLAVRGFYQEQPA